MNTIKPKIIIVPVKERSKNPPQIKRGANLLKVLWKQRKLSFWIVLFSMSCWLFVALMQPPQFISRTTLLPEYARSIGYAGNVIDTQIRAIISPISTSTYRGRTDAIRIDQYPSIMTSDLVLSNVLSELLVDSSSGFSLLPGNLSTKEYLLYENESTIIDQLVESIENIPYQTFKEVTFNNNGNFVLSNRFQYFHLQKDEQKALNMLKRRVYSSFDMDTGAISLSVRMSDPFIAALISKIIIDHTHQIIIEYQKEKFKIDYEFLKSEMDSAMRSMERERTELARFLDHNNDIYSAEQQANQFQKQYDFNLATSVYKSFLYQVEESRLKSKEETPLFTYLQPSSVPIVSESSHKIKIFFIAIIFTIFLIAVQNLIRMKRKS